MILLGHAIHKTINNNSLLGQLVQYMLSKAQCLIRKGSLNNYVQHNQIGNGFEILKGTIN
jgi:hypothetical protein